MVCGWTDVSASVQLSVRPWPVAARPGSQGVQVLCACAANRWETAGTAVGVGLSKRASSLLLGQSAQLRLMCDPLVTLSATQGM